MAAIKRFKLKSVPKKVHVGHLRKFMNFYNLSNAMLKRIVTEGPKSDPSVPEEERSFEAAVYDDFNKYFTPNNMATLSKKAKGPLVDLFNTLKDHKNPSMKTEQQRAKAKELTETILSGAEPVYEQLGSPEQQVPVDTQITPEDILRQSITTAGKDAVAAISKRFDQNIKDQEKAELEAAKTPKQKKAVKDKFKARRDRFEKIGKIGKGAGEVLGQAVQAYQQGAPPVERFGGETKSPLISEYDNLINAIRPDRTTGQRIAGALAPQATNMGATIGGTIGSLINPGLGSSIGTGVGAAAGYGGGALLDYMSRPDPELAPIGDLLAGSRAGYLWSGKRGLADLIAGTPAQLSTARKAFNLANPWRWFGRENPTRFQRARRAIAQPVRGIGEFIRQPGRAGQLRSLLEAGVALHGIGKQLGINPWISKQARRLAERLGLVGPEEQQGNLQNLGGTDVAAAMLPSIYKYAVPELQQQAAGFFGRPVGAGEAASGFEQQILAALGPQMAKQNIKASKIGSRRQDLGFEQAGVGVGQQTNQALNRLDAFKQQQRYLQAQRKLAFQGRENAEQARMQAARNNLSLREAISGEPVMQQPPLVPIQPTSGVEQALYGVAQGAQQVTTPYVQHQLNKLLTPQSKSTAINKK